MLESAAAQIAGSLKSVCDVFCMSKNAGTPKITPTIESGNNRAMRLAK